MDKIFRSAAIKAADDTGTISGYFSTYDIDPDSYGDIVAPGAFTKTLAAREATGHPFPLCWNHDLDQIIGTVDSVEDTENGPLMKATFLDTPLAQEKRTIVKSGSVYQFSFAYAVTGRRDPTKEEKEKGVENVLTEVDLYEVSIVPVPANQHAVMTDVKGGNGEDLKDREALKRTLRILKRMLGDSVEEKTEKTEEEAPEDKAPEAEDQKKLNEEQSRILEYINTNIKKEKKQ
jgi:hypothetical protein